MKSIIIILTFFISVIHGFSQSITTNFDLIFSKDYLRNDTLIIKTIYKECGEWGGHLELSKIFIKDSNFYFLYKKYSTNCDGIREYGVPNQKQEKTLEKKITENDKTAILNYIHQLKYSNKNQVIPSFYGIAYSILNSKKTIEILLNSEEIIDQNHYETLIYKIFTVSRALAVI